MGKGSGGCERPSMVADGTISLERSFTESLTIIPNKDGELFFVEFHSQKGEIEYRCVDAITMAAFEESEDWDTLLHAKVRYGSIIDNEVLQTRELFTMKDDDEIVAYDWGAMTPEELAAVSVDDVIGVNYYNHSLWQPASRKPWSRPYRVEAWGSYIGLDKLEAILDGHPWVKDFQRKANISQNWGISGSESAYVTVLMPQEVHDRFYDAWVQDPNETKHDAGPNKSFSGTHLQAYFFGYGQDEMPQVHGLPADPLGVHAAVSLREDTEQYNDDNYY